MRFFTMIFCLMLATISAHAAEEKSLVERLGYPADARLLIANGDDFGMNHATNDGTIEALKTGGLSSATIMVPCPWFPETVDFAKNNPQANLGLHLTLTSEWGRYKWGPVAGRGTVPSLVDKLGYFKPDVPLVYMGGRLDHVETEIRAQIDRALAAGIDVTHVDSHMGTLQYHPKYHEVYIKVAKSYDLPCRIAGHDLMDPRGGAYLIEMADDMNVIHPDHLYNDGPPKVKEEDQYQTVKAFWEKRLTELPVGKVSELYIHCGRRTPEMRATTGTWNVRSADTDYFASAEWQEALKREKVQLISYRELRHLQRTGEAPPKKDFYGWE